VLYIIGFGAGQASGCRWKHLQALLEPLKAPAGAVGVVEAQQRGLLCAWEVLEAA